MRAVACSFPAWYKTQHSVYETDSDRFNVSNTRFTSSALTLSNLIYNNQSLLQYDVNKENKPTHVNGIKKQISSI